jgi:serine phosphatase RsbU (regulator of sigma subunit)/CHASE2 domain-containing sensor protein
VPDTPAAAKTEARRERWRRLLGRSGIRIWGTALALLFCAALLLPDPGFVPGLRYLGFDSYQRLWPRQRSAQPAVIVAIDDRSLAEVGQWPWPRDTVARLVQRVAARKPAVIGVDILFAEPDRTSPDRLAEQFRAADPRVSELLQALPSHDAMLGRALAQSPVVLGVIGTDSPGSGGEGFAPARVLGSVPKLLSYRDGQRSRPEIDSGASGHGLFNAELDDGVVRRVPLVASVAGYPLLSLPLECLRVAAGEPVFSVVSQRSRSLQVVIGDLSIPAQTDGRLFLHYAGHSPARYVSAVDVLMGRDDPDQIAGRVALIGVTGQGLVDQQLTPQGERLPGVEVHAEVIENVFEGSLLQRPFHARGIEAFAFALLAALSILWVPRLSPPRSSLVLLGGALLLLGSGAAAYTWQRQLFDPLTPLLGLGALHAALVLATMMAIELERRSLAAKLVIEREAAARTAGEFEAGRRIQTGMLPRPEKVLARETRVELFAHMQPAREVGGDLYDFFFLDQRRLFAVVGDVAGKGLAAALFMAVSKALTKSSSLRGRGNLGDLLESVNIELARDNPDDLFVTLLAVCLDLDTGRLEYCNAGHEPLLLIAASGEVKVLDEGGGPPLCVFDFARYTSTTVQLARGDGLALVSDGITECLSPAGKLFGREALKALLQSIPGNSADGLGQQLMARVAEFECGAEPSDDQTLLVLRWLSPKAPTPPPRA